MITVVELPEYIRKSERLLDEEERDNVVEYVARNPRTGALVTGTGGVRKMRWARKGMGKSGGARIIYFFYNENIPVFLLTAFGKNEKTNLTKAECNELAKLTTLLVKSYKRGDK
ncbi:MAG: type II toxin-antitoxin system RelE/ParE family toxin [Candidatus Aminicenantes bacterium]|nr:type II toxin-antitoxin system RelE/ParE family toxin [Candidatus Aminicenantes bacterium]NIM82706.1 type II toxin-antitoxin system RelE/ParE family toxin [Candidatus Aminicenantes bacterium]NIN22078.1 type II toxin-antitoxin system RelE/ParE family toxin [Candidatus Aminicenantes bacterium]NIN45837.1 type II toxin-antitoxin system RelE/ParE family toxin [Candidatus Aminicenantes bacterium]NIN88674.1 type II toxin-antitoxin system RelE/ParE family toxin [Candidatus Aminicenantes bacterium]